MSAVGRGIVLRQVDRLFGEGSLTGLGDGQLLERYLAQRDEDAFAMLVDLHGPMVLGLCRRMLHDPRDVEDAFQATFLVLVRKAPAIRDRERLSSWLYGVAFRVARRARSRTLKRRGWESSVGVPEAEAEAGPAEPFEVGPMLDQELSRLPEKYRAPLVLCYLRGRTHEQAAEDLRCPVGTVRSRMARGRDLLRKRLTRRGFAPAAIGGFLAGDPGLLPAPLLVADVPPAMAAATVRAAAGFGSPSLIKVSVATASSVVLARGVLTSMRIAQLQWFGIALVATGISAGGVVAGGIAAANRGEAGRNDERIVVASRETGQEKTAAHSSALADDERRQLLENIRKLIQENEELRKGRDELKQQVESFEALKRSREPQRPDFRPRTPGRTALPTAPVRTEPAGPDVRSNPSPARETAPGELEVELAAAARDVSRLEAYARRKVVGEAQVEAARTRLLILAARVESIADEIRDQFELLEIERRRKAALVEMAQAELEVATALVARDRQLNGRQPNVVGPDEVAHNEGQFKAAAASVKLGKIDVARVDLQMHQLERRRERMRAVEKQAAEARAAGNASPVKP